MSTSNQALIIIDVQQAMFDPAAPVYQGDALLEKLQGLIVQARSNHIPIVYVQHEEEEGPLVRDTPSWVIHPAIAPEAGDVVVHKSTPDSFYQTTLQHELRKRNIHETILVGIQTELCVDTTCRAARSLGFQVTLVQDAHSTFDSADLKAEQIIQHHNQVLQSFASLKNANEITFK
ncbi:cysteine hydrolase family protein [Paenibacillus guangzhouensis]|uniref:cysteine hydrolase family protein n=1 Tax=Paenibacillus guangzhouensis TaxID=1473112 RepID=UPI001266D49B|nr:cysteine hydrolase family protein [Paenibacillus guangzhouensis]